MAFGTFSKDMQLTRTEFERRLSKDVAGFCWRMTPEGAQGVRGSHLVHISVAEQEPRRIAWIVLPRCLVEITCTGMNADEQRDFIQKFDQVFQKGGG